MHVTPSVFSAIPGRRIAEILLAAFWTELLTLSIPLFAQLIFDKVIVHASFSTLYVVGAGVLAACLFEGLLAYLYARHVHLLAARMDEHLTHPALEKLLGLPLSYFDGRPRGEIAATLRQVQSVRDVLSATYLSALVDIAVMALVLLLMAAYSLLLAGIVALSIPFLLFLTIMLRPGVAAHYRELNRRQSKYEALLDEGLQGMATIKSFALEPTWRQRWISAHEAFVDSMLRARRGAAIEDSVTRMLQRLLLAGVLMVGATQVLSGDLSLGELLASYMLSVRVLLPCTRVFQVYMGFVQIRSALRGLEQLDAEQEEKDSPRATDFVPGDICLRGVQFRYGPDLPPVLAGADLIVPRGIFAGIVGPSGCGKSTLARLLQRHLAAQEGSVTIADRDVREISLRSLRRQVLVLTHDAVLFHATVRENIVGDSACSDEVVWKACEAAEAAEFVRQLPHGLETLLDERGTRLSSGQRQRIALARALCADPAILVLDEATNALDTETEAVVLRRVRAVLPDATIVVVTHRPHVLTDAQLVLEVCRGRIRDRDTFDNIRQQLVSMEQQDAATT